MARTGALKHTHQYFRRPDKKWACLRDGCTHFMPSNMAPAPAGSLSICWMCEQEFRLLPVNMERERPLCDKCLASALEIERKYFGEDEDNTPDSPEVLRRYGFKPTKQVDKPTSE